MTTVTTVETWRCVVPLPKPVLLGNRVIPTREYQVLRLKLNDGTIGTAVGYTRGLPMTDLVGSIARLYRETDVSDPAATTHKVLSILSQTARTLARAVALFDIAMWDAAARGRGMPLWALLGSNRPRPSLVAVCGYYSESRTNEDIAAEVAMAVARGHRSVKLIAPPPQRGNIHDYFAVVRSAIPSWVSHSMDFYNRYANFEAASADLLELDDGQLEFIEDPFPPGSWHEYARASELILTPFAAGEDALDAREWKDLVEFGGVRILRVDATASGGVSAVVDAVADLRPRPRVYPHVFAALHAQLGAVGRVESVEVIAKESGTDPLAKLGPCELTVDAEGRAVVPEGTLGAGLDFDWQAVAHYADRYEQW